MPLIEQALGIQLRQRPPDALDIAAVIGDVGFLAIHPEADATIQLLPFLGVDEHGFLAGARERLDAIGLDRLLAENTQGLLDLHLDRQAMGIPATASRYPVPAHGPIATDQILGDPGQHMTVMGCAVRGRRSLVKQKVRLRLGALQPLIINLSSFPEIEDFLFKR